MIRRKGDSGLTWQTLRRRPMPRRERAYPNVYLLMRGLADFASQAARISQNTLRLTHKAKPARPNSVIPVFCMPLMYIRILRSAHSFLKHVTLIGYTKAVTRSISLPGRASARVHLTFVGTFQKPGSTIAIPTRGLLRADGTGYFADRAMRKPEASHFAFAQKLIRPNTLQPNPSLQWEPPRIM